MPPPDYEKWQSASSAQADQPSNARLGGWVIWSNDKSIARGQISVLALIEIPFAMALFWWISSLTPWPWLTLLGLMAAPLLLLRSPQSIESGLKLFTAYLEINTSELSSDGKKTLAVVLLLGTFFSSYLVTSLASQYMTGGELYSYAALYSTFAMIAVISFAKGVCHGLKAMDDLLWEHSPRMSDFDGTEFSKYGQYGKLAAIPVLFLILALFLAISILQVFIVVTAIRLWATIKNISPGIVAFPFNWRHTVYVIDLCHMPELLPRAGELDDKYTLKGLLSYKSKGAARKNWGDKFFLALTKSTTALVIYCPALLYRWNLKASVWIWGPVAWVLRPAVWACDEDMRCDTAFWTTKTMLGILWLAVVSLLGWLAFPYLPASVSIELPGLVKAVAKQWPAPTVGVRYVMLLLLALSVLGLLFSGYRVRAPYAKPLEHAVDYRNDSANELRIKALAKTVQRWLQWNFAVMVLTVWTFALWWALERWPNDLQNVVWDWVKPML